MIELSQDLEINTKGKLMLWGEMEVVGIETIYLKCTSMNDEIEMVTFATTYDDENT